MQTLLQMNEDKEGSMSTSREGDDQSVESRDTITQMKQ